MTGNKSFVSIQCGRRLGGVIGTESVFPLVILNGERSLMKDKRWGVDNVWTIQSRDTGVTGPGSTH